MQIGMDSSGDPLFIGYQQWPNGDFRVELGSRSFMLPVSAPVAGVGVLLFAALTAALLARFMWLRRRKV